MAAQAAMTSSRLLPMQRKFRSTTIVPEDADRDAEIFALLLRIATELARF